MKSGKSNNEVIYKEVVIIGNGPSGIALSYMLSGNLPFLTSHEHPDEMLSARLSPAVGECLIKHDLGEMAAGLEGRSTNPVSLLMDSLLHPCADIGMEMAPLVQFKKVGTEIDHLVLGKGPPGGSWHKMDPYILTLSLGSWMALPGLPFTARDSSEKRAYACNVANYYVQYVKEMDLERFFNNNVSVSKVDLKEFEIGPPEKMYASHLDENEELPKSCPIYNALNCILSKTHRKQKPSRCCKRSRDDLCQGLLKADRNTKQHQREEIRSVLSVSCNSCDSYNHNGRTNNNTRKTARVPFRISNCNEDERNNCDKQTANWLVQANNVESGETTTYVCKYLVLANGASDRPNKLDVSTHKQDPHWLYHDLRSLEQNLDELIKSKHGAINIDPVLIVGAGLSAADAVIAVRERNVMAVHIYRNKAADLNKQLPENMYPEYHKVHQMMQDGGSSYPNYTSYPEYTLLDVDETTRSVILTAKSGETLKIRVSFAVVLIGSRPDLSFLREEVSLGVNKDMPIDSKTNPIAINKLTHQVEGFENLFAIGPLAGDHFVRFIPGGALSVVKELYRRNNYSCKELE